MDLLYKSTCLLTFLVSTIEGKTWILGLFKFLVKQKRSSDFRPKEVLYLFKIQTIIMFDAAAVYLINPAEKNNK